MPDKGDMKATLSEIWLDIASMLNFEDVLSFYAATAKTDEEKANATKLLERYERTHFESLVFEVAEKTGDDAGQIADINARTPEQQKALLEASAQRQLEKINLFLDSDLLKVKMALDSVNSVFDDYDKEQHDNGISIAGAKYAFMMYYFSTHPDIKPSAKGKFTKADKKEMIQQFRRFESFLVDQYGEHAAEAPHKDFISVLQAFIAKENPEDAKEIIETLNSVLPDKFVSANNKLANMMTKDIIDAVAAEINVSQSKKKPIITTCVMTYEGDNVKLSGRHTFTEYDRNVYDAVSSLYVYGNQSMTPAMVYRAMNGLTETEKPTAGQLEDVMQSLDKMRFIRARIDCTEELKARNITLNSKQINGGEIDTNLLMAKWIKVYVGGQVVRALKLVDVPILYEYASAVNQVLTFPASALDIKEINADGSIGARLPNTEPRIRIKGYLLRRIEGMKGKNKLKSPIIALYDYEKNNERHRGLFSIAGNPDPSRTEAARIREDAEKMLAYWAATGTIKKFEAQRERKKIIGYKITV